MRKLMKKSDDYISSPAGCSAVGFKRVGELSSSIAEVMLYRIQNVP